MKKGEFEHHAWGGPKNNRIKELYNEHAFINFFQETPNQFVIQDLHSHKPGEAKKAVKALIDTIGPNKHVDAMAVIEPESRRRLKELGILDYVEKTGKNISINAPGVINSTKMSRVLKGGGLVVDNILVSPIPDDVDSDMDEGYLNPKVSVKIRCHT